MFKQQPEIQYDKHLLRASDVASQEKRNTEMNKTGSLSPTGCPRGGPR